jgi:phosphatidylethanolamine/phosphatidyl-N-methylethanolamine N-methyltransferase
MRQEPNYSDYMENWSKVYQGTNYDQGLAAWFLRKSHEWCERPFDVSSIFSRVLEVGAGTGVHIKYVRHQFSEYWVTDLHLPMLNRAEEKITGSPSGKVFYKLEDASRLSFADQSFDRVIATHVLEHLPEPHKVLREWIRVIKPDGILSIVLPCDPGLAWRVGRMLGPRRSFQKQGIDYDYWMAREHINPINNLVTFIRHYFEDLDEQWLPLRVPLMDVNLFYIVHIKVHR